MRTALLSLAAAVVGGVPAQEATDALKKRQAEWREQVARETQTLREQYAQMLARTEQELVAKRQYAAAKKVRSERAAVMRSLGKSIESSGGGAKDNTSADEKSVGSGVVLSAAKARPEGGVKLAQASGEDSLAPAVLVGWTAPGAKARWTLPEGLAGGGYDVEVTYATAPDAGGTIEMAEEFHRLRRDVKAGAGWDDFRTEVLGTLRLLTNSRVLELSAAAVKGSELFRLRSVRLIPVAGKP